MYMASDGFYSHTFSPLQEHHQGMMWGAHASDCSPGSSTTAPDSEEFHMLSQGPWQENEREQGHHFEWKTPENSPRSGYHQDILPQYASPTPQSPQSTGCEGASPAAMGTPVAGVYYMQMPVVFMMIPMVPSYQQQADSQSETSPGNSAYSVREKHCNEEQPMHAQSGHDLLQPSMPDVAASREVPAGFTTLVVRNVPARYTPNMLLQEFGPDGSFDFFFLPYSFRDSKTMGVAFINFRSHDLALCFQERWQRRFLQQHGRTKHLDIAAATLQGVVENLKQFNPRSIARLERAGILPIFLDSLGDRLDAVQELKRYGVLPAAW